MPDGRASTTRPVIFGRTASPKTISPRRGGRGRAECTDPDQRARRIDARFDEASSALDEQVQLVASIHAADPQLVLVLEALDEQIDLTRVAQRLGIEILAEAEGASEPTAEFQLRSAQPKNPLITSCLHAVCTDITSFEKMRRLWRIWNIEPALPRGYSALGELFAHLKDLRPWGPQDRLGSIDWDDYFAGRIDDRPHTIEVELWYRHTAARRQQSQQEVSTLIQEAGGVITSTATIDQIGYHGMKCTVPTHALRDLASGNHDAVQMIRSTDVMYMRIAAQSLPAVGPPTESLEQETPRLPTGNAVLCLLDGVPAANHPLLRDRVTVYDPDDLASRATVDELRHGTWMSSVAVWGDRARTARAAVRPVLVRPVLTPAEDTQDRHEEISADVLVPDLMWRTFRELFDGTGNEPPAAPDVMIINISIGDPAAPFDTIMSSWARIIDWLSYEYGVLVVVSAGNHQRLKLSPASSSDVIAATGPARRRIILEAICRSQAGRRLLAPAEAVNAITVGAVHADGSPAAPQGYAVDPMDGLFSVSPISPTGSGYRRSIKPDLAASGGRVFFRDGITPQDAITFAGLTKIGPGIKVATPTQFEETHIAGTSPAAVLMSRRAARLHDVVDQITVGITLTRQQKVSAIKALLVHGTSVAREAEHAPLAGSAAFGNGIAARDLSDGCASNEAVVLYVGSIGANQEQELLFPLPNGLSVRETKRIDATLAWLTPTNWRHRQYRRAALAFVTPAGSIPKLETPNGVSYATSTRGATTVQRQTWELKKAFASGQGSNMSVRVKCYEQAGGLLGERVDFAVALSLWVAPTLGVDVYSQVRTQVESRVVVRPQI